MCIVHELQETTKILPTAILECKQENTLLWFRLLYFKATALVVLGISTLLQKQNGKLTNTKEDFTVKERELQKEMKDLNVEMQNHQSAMARLNQEKSQAEGM